MKISIEKICFLFIFVLAGITSGKAQRIYASELSAVQQSDTSWVIRYTLNATATRVAVILNQGAITLPFTSPESLQKGCDSVVITANQVNQSGSFTWSVQATGAAVEGSTSWVKFTNENQNPLLNYYAAFGMAADNSFESPYFGRIYVGAMYGTGPRSTTFSTYTTAPGVYVLNAALDDATAQADKPYAGGISWVKSANSPQNIAIDAGGKVYLNDPSTNTGVFIMNPANPDANFTHVFGGANTYGVLQNTSTGDYISGTAQSMCVSGAADSTILYVIDERLGTGPANGMLGLSVGYNGVYYNLGSASLPWVANPTGAFFNNAAACTQYGGYMGMVLYSVASNPTNGTSLAIDGRGGIFISQDRSTTGDNLSVPSILHATPSKNSTGTYHLDYNSGDPANNGNGTVKGSYDGIIAVSRDGSLLAVCNSASPIVYKVFNVTYNADNAPALVLASSFTSASGTPHSMTFDAAGNLYVMTTASTLQGFAPVTAENTFTTPASLSQPLLNFVATGIKTPKLTSSQLQVFPNPVEDVVCIKCAVEIISVKLVDLTGRTMMNIPASRQLTATDVNLSGVPAGNYILLVNNTPVKIEKK